MLRMLKLILYLVWLLPLAALCQTVHIKDEKIDYSGEVLVAPSAVTTRCVEQALKALAAPYALTWVHGEPPYAVRGSFHLRAPYQQLHIVYFTLEVAPLDSTYRYHLYEVSLVEGERGVRPEVMKSKALLKGLDESGAPAAAAEHTLNEIDMNIEALLVRLQKATAGVRALSSQ